MRTKDQKKAIADKIYEHYQTTDRGEARWEEAHDMAQADDTDAIDGADHIIDDMDEVYGQHFDEADWFGSGAIGTMSIRDHIYESIINGLT